MHYNDTKFILCATDNNYAPYCGIMLTSLLENNKDYRFCIYVANDGSISAKNEKRFSQLQSKYNCEIVLKVIDSSPLELFPLNKKISVDGHSWVTLPTYYRLLAADIFPSDVKSVLYLDCDILVVGDLGRLWEIDLSDKAIAGVIDDNSDGNCIRLGYSTELKYFNAGVSMYNLDYWRANNVFESFSKYANQSRREKLLMMDQDILNGSFLNKKILLPERYNFMVTYLDKSCWANYTEAFREELVGESKEAAVIHYDTGIKPWDFRYYGFPFWKTWDDWRRRSLWKEAHITKPKKEYFRFILKRILVQKSLIRKRSSLWISLS